MYEDIIRMTLGEAIKYYKENSPRGEYVLILEGKSLEELQEEERSKWNSLSVEEHIKTYIEEGFSKKDAIKKVAKDRDMPKSEVYKYSINI